MITIKYDVPFEVNEKQYKEIVKKCEGIMCHKIKDGKYFIKVWLMGYTWLIRKILRENE